MAVGALVLGVISFAIDKEYQATSLVGYRDWQSGNASPQSGASLQGFTSLLGIGGNANEGRSLAIASLKSKDTTISFLKHYNLVDVLWMKHQKNLGTENAKNYFAYKEWSKKIFQVQEDKRTSLISLSVTWPDNKKAKEIVDSFVVFINKKLSADALATATKRIDYLTSQIQTSNINENKQLAYKLLENEYRLKMLALLEEEFSFKVVDSAIAPPLNDPISPNKRMLVIIGAILGFFFSFLIISYLRISKKEIPSQQ